MNNSDVAKSDVEWLEAERRRFADPEPGHQFARLRLEYAAFRAIVAAEVAEAKATVAKRERAAKGTPAREAKKDGRTLSATATDKVDRTKDKRAVAAKSFRVSERKVRAAAALKKAAPAKAEAVRRGEITLKDAEREVRKETREQERNHKAQAAATMKHTPCIIIDTREQTPLVFANLPAEPGALDAGEHLISGGAGVVSENEAAEAFAAGREFSDAEAA